MKIKDFIYKLQRHGSHTKPESSDIQNCLETHPTLSAFDIGQVYKAPLYNDVDKKLSSSAVKEFINDLGKQNEWIKEINHMNDLQNEEKLTYLSGESPAVMNQGTISENPSKINADFQFTSTDVIPKFENELYHVEESEFVKYLKTLPSCKPPSLKETDGLDRTTDSISDQNLKEADELIQKSLDLSQNVGSESLAKLWASQGKLDLAISMYQKLATEFPEKSATFAAKIENLKSENSL